MASPFRFFGPILVALLLQVANGAKRPTMEFQFKAVTVKYINPEYLIPKETFFRISRNSRNRAPTLTVFLPFISDIPADMKATFQNFHKTRNTWRSSLVKGEVLFCSMLGTNLQLYKDMFDNSDFKTCPLKKGNYTIRDVLIQGDSLPPMLAAGDLMIRFAWIAPSVTILSWDLEAKVVKRGANGGDGSDAAFITALNQSLGG